MNDNHIPNEAGSAADYCGCSDVRVHVRHFQRHQHLAQFLASRNRRGLPLRITLQPVHGRF
jgi:hypothetical protein